MVDRVEAILAAEKRSREQMARQFDSFSNAVSFDNFHLLYAASIIIQIPTTESSRSKLKQKLKTKVKKSSSPKVKTGAKAKTTKTENRRRGTFSSPRATSAFMSRQA